MGFENIIPQIERSVKGMNEKTRLILKLSIEILKLFGLVAVLIFGVIGAVKLIVG